MSNTDTGTLEFAVVNSLVGFSEEMKRHLGSLAVNIKRGQWEKWQGFAKQYVEIDANKKYRFVSFSFQHPGGEKSGYFIVDKI